MFETSLIARFSCVILSSDSVARSRALSASKTIDSHCWACAILRPVVHVSVQTHQSRGLQSTTVLLCRAMFNLLCQAIFLLLSAFTIRLQPIHRNKPGMQDIQILNQLRLQKATMSVHHLHLHCRLTITFHLQTQAHYQSQKMTNFAWFAYRNPERLDSCMDRGKSLFYCESFPFR